MSEFIDLGFCWAGECSKCSATTIQIEKPERCASCEAPLVEAEQVLFEIEERVA